jgi:hypothetical protein
MKEYLANKQNNLSDDEKLRVHSRCYSTRLRPSLQRALHVLCPEDATRLTLGGSFGHPFGSMIFFSLFFLFLKNIYVFLNFKKKN